MTSASGRLPKLTPRHMAQSAQRLCRQRMVARMISDPASDGGHPLDAVQNKQRAAIGRPSTSRAPK